MSSPSKAVDVIAVLRRMAAQAAACRGAGAGSGTQQIEDERAIAALVELAAFARWIAERHDEKSVEGQAARAALSTIGESQ